MPHFIAPPRLVSYDYCDVPLNLTRMCNPLSIHYSRIWFGCLIGLPLSDFDVFFNLYRCVRNISPKKIVCYFWTVTAIRSVHWP